MRNRLFKSAYDADKSNRRAQFDALPSTQGKVVFLGDSITEGGEWSEWFPNHPTANRGVGAETIEEVSARLGSAVNAPRAISLLIGTNDIGGFGRTNDPDQVAEQYGKLIRSIQVVAPESAIIISSVMPRHRVFASALRRLNSQIEVLAESAGVSYIDLWPTFEGADGGIRRDFSFDQLHLNGAGYSAWVDMLRPAFDRLLGPD